MNKLSALCLILIFITAESAFAREPDYSQLDPKPYNPETDANIDLYMRNWQESMPRKTHGSLVERDILTRGDSSNPATRGEVLKYVNRLVHATLGAYESTAPTTLREEQEIFYVYSGKGTIKAGNETAELYHGVAALVPPELEFTITNSTGESLAMFLISEPVPDGFKPKEKIRVVCENSTPFGKSNPHWVGLGKGLLGKGHGLATLSSVGTVRLDAMTFFHPHSHPEGIEEVWTAITDDIHVFFGKQIRLQKAGTAYLVPPNGKTPHANFNVSDKMIKMFYFSSRHRKQ
ncbi:MAG: hypothetical protein HOC71_04140 [Candidatus Latescibacteria bacterium]|jgi:mannose-6-phosphate isomerase-like protein (cupin superfamily)|nr:hypothetical protein [Candidatus Latescibacterota bacterium]